jgi:hypothetical protein
MVLSDEKMALLHELFIVAFSHLIVVDFIKLF